MASGSALETFDVVQNDTGQTNQPDIGSTDLVDDWKFESLDIPQESRQDFIHRMEQLSGERIEVRMRIVTITTTHSSSRPIEERKGVLQASQDAISLFLKGESFRELTRAEFSNMPFHNTDEMREFMLKTIY